MRSWRGTAYKGCVELCRPSSHQYLISVRFALKQADQYLHTFGGFASQDISEDPHLDSGVVSQIDKIFAPKFTYIDIVTYWDIRLHSAHNWHWPPCGVHGLFWSSAPIRLRTSSRDQVRQIKVVSCYISSSCALNAHNLVVCKCLILLFEPLNRWSRHRYLLLQLDCQSSTNYINLGALMLQWYIFCIPFPKKTAPPLACWHRWYEMCHKS